MAEVEVTIADFIDTEDSTDGVRVNNAGNVVAARGEVRNGDRPGEEIDGSDDQAPQETLTGTNDDDIVTAGLGNDVVNGGFGDDLILGQAGNDVLRGEGGNDAIFGGGGDDLVRGGNGNDIVLGGNGSDDLRGENGADIIDGGNGDDIIRGGQGSDVLIGGAGSDTFMFKVGADFKKDSGDRDIVADFTMGEDVLDLIAHSSFSFDGEVINGNFVLSIFDAGDDLRGKITFNCIDDMQSFADADAAFVNALFNSPGEVEEPIDEIEIGEVIDVPVFIDNDSMLAT